MKKIISAAVICMIFLTGCGREKNSLEKIMERGVIYAAVRTDAKPFGYIDETGINAGFDIDTAEYIAEKITGNPNNVEFIPVAASERIEAVLSGKADMIIAAMSNTESRQQFVDFSIPYYTAGQTAAVKKNSRIYTFSDLKDKTVITVSGSTAKQNIRRIAPSAKILEYAGHNEAFKALKDGRGDAVCTDDTFIAGFISQNKDYRMLKNRISSEKYSIGIQKTDDKMLKYKLDAVINEMNENGTFKSLKKKWFLD